MKVLTTILLLFLLLPLSSEVVADVGYFEEEPNNTPQEFNRISGPVTLYGNLAGQDQDGYLWTVSDEDARKRWTFELQGIPGAGLTQVQVMKLEYADNGVDVTGRTTLFKMGTRDGTRPSIHEDLIFEPGEYVFGVAGGGYATEPGSDEGGGYRFLISGASLPLSRDPGAQADMQAAHSLNPESEFATFESDELAWYRLNFDASHQANRWAISVRFPVGRRADVSLHDGEGQALVKGRPNDKGLVEFRHLVPPAGPWYLKLESKKQGMVHSIVSEPIGLHVAGEEAEPNNKRRDANQIDLATPLTGRIETGDLHDFFLFNIPETEETVLRTLNVDSPAPAKMTFCLQSDKGKDVQCKEGSPPLQFPSLDLAAGDWYINIRRARAQSYTVSLEAEGSSRPGSEVEPNDQIDHATGVSEKLRIRGRFSGADTDHYRFLITGEAQLWRFQVNGDGLESMAYLDGRGRSRVSMRADKGTRRVRMDNVFLPPGRHTLRLKGKDSDYMLIARPLGPPVAVLEATDDAVSDSEPKDQTKTETEADRVSALWNPDGEVEPNDASNMQRLAVGQTRTGSLPNTEDEDYYRFFVANDDHLRLTIEPPEDGSIHPYLNWYGLRLGVAEKRADGETITYQGVLPPGDYTLHLTTRSPSEKPYRLKLERLPRFSCAKDCEPNNLRPLRRVAPLPLDLRLEGEAQGWNDPDAYQLPAMDQETELLIRTETPLFRPYLMTPEGNRSGQLNYDKTLGAHKVVLPAGQPQTLLISGRRNEPYDAQLEFPGGELAPVMGDLEIDLQLEMADTKVAAFLDYGQQLMGQLRVRNPGAAARALTVTSATSDHRWVIETDRDALAVDPDGELVVPVNVQVPSDAWADHTVRLSIKVEDAQGRHVEAWADIEVARDVTGVNTALHWPVPESLRGGFNAAWVPFGGEIAGDAPRNVELPQLRDGMVFPSTVMRCCGGGKEWKEGLGHRWTLELPGEAPLPVAGIALDGFGANVLQTIRQGRLLLSEDGENYTEALRFETLPILTEQFFALAEPVQARFVQLHITSTFEYPSNNIGMGEWKVLLTPGFDLSQGKGFNLADPDYGGHLAWMWPPTSGAQRILDEDAKARSVRVEYGGKSEYVIGFNRNRAARVTKIEWKYDDSSSEATRNFSSVRISRSLESPIGPWVAIGEVALTPAQDSFEFDLEDAPFARFVRFEAVLANDQRQSIEPVQIRIWEMPGGDQYSSVLTEWGEAGGRAFYESQKRVSSGTMTQAGNATKAEAADLTLGAQQKGAVSLGRNEHWYRLVVPADVNTLQFLLGGEPTVRTVLSIEDAMGRPIAVHEPNNGRSPVQHLYEAVVEPGQEVFVKIAEPPRNVVFSWDTSGSVGAYIPRINNSVMAFSGEVRAEHEWVNLLPFGSGMLLSKWTDQSQVLQTVLNDFRRESDSSAAELALYKATNAMTDRAGTKAVVIVTDAVTPYYGEMWRPMSTIQPRIFGIGVASSGIEGQNRFRDWAQVNGGDYRQLRYLGEMDVAFDRASTKMHRPAVYTLQVEGEFREAPGPGRLQVVSTQASQTAVALILDASGSMLQRLDGKRRIEIAKEVLTDVVRERIPKGTPLALRVFGHKEVDSCRTDLEISLGPLDPESAASRISEIRAMNLARTPIADSLAAVEKDLKGNTNSVVVLVTDGEETCEGDPAAVIEGLRDRGFDISLSIVGFAIDDPELGAQFERWAELGGGRYFGAQDEAGLSSAIQNALKMPFSVFDIEGNPVATGQVDGDSLALEAGEYKVVVSGQVERTFEPVVIQGEDNVVVSLEE